MTMAQRKKTKKIVLTIVMLILALIYIYPVFLMVINSVKPFGEVIMDVIALPSKIEWSNYTYVMDKMQYGKLFLNNVIITVIGIVGIIIFSSMSAYIISRKKNKYTSSAEPASYNASGYEGSGYFVITKTMVPLTKNRVRINIGTKRLPAEPENQPDFIKKNTIVIEVADDNSLTVEPYDPEEMEVETVDVKVAHPGDNAYALYNNRLDPTTTTFCVCYKYRLKTGSWTEVREAIRLPVIVIE